MRKPHIIDAPNGNRGHPSRLITFDVETRPSSCQRTAGAAPCPACRRITAGRLQPADEVQVLTLGCALDWEGSELTFRSAGVFWDWVDARTTTSGPTWLVNHNISFDLMVLKWDSSLRARGWTADKIIIPEPSGPFHVTWTNGRRRLHMTNLANWWGMRPLASIGQVIGSSKGDLDPTLPRYRHARSGTFEWNQLETYCAQDARVVYDAVGYWSRFCVEHDLGPFAITQAGQSLNAYRHRFMAHPIYIHTNARALELERSSYLGGRTEAFRLGRIPGRTHIVDVNSLYPYVMSSNDFPTRLTGVVDRLTRSDLVTLMRDQLLVASVTCSVDNEGQRVVPVRHDGRLLYPTGRFPAVLCTPELVTALAAGVVDSIGDVAVYDRAPLFHEYVSHFYALRLRYKEAGNLVWHEIVKVFLNSLYGKFGQYNHEWTSCEDTVAIPPGTHVIDDDGQRITYRNLGGILRRKSDHRIEGYNSFAAIAAHVTAHARTHITRLRDIAGISNVVYCDTDSLFVNDEGLGALSQQIDGMRLGALKHEGTTTDLVIRGLKDYTFGTVKKLKGIRRSAIDIGGGQWQQAQFRGIAGALRAGEPDIARVGVIVKKPTLEYKKGAVGEGGWVVPVHLDVIP